MIAETGESASHTVNPGESVSLSCGASGIPLPILTWMKGGFNLTASDRLEIKTTFINTTHMTSVLEIGNAAPSDAGTYICVAVNDAQTASISVEVNVSKYYYNLYTVPCMHL